MTLIDKKFVKKSFNSSAITYDKYAALHKRMVEQLLQFTDCKGLSVSNALDIGTGTGNLLARLKEEFPAAQVHGCDIAINMVLYARKKLSPPPKQKQFFAAADAEFLPYRESTFDLVVSSFAYQWLEQWDRALEDVIRVLKPGGTFVFSAFGEKTFKELRESYAKACIDTGYTQGEALQLSLTKGKMQHILTLCGFIESCTLAYRIVETYETVNDLISAIRGMGARNASGQRNKTPGVRKIWGRMVELYERDFGVPGKIPATFEVIMGKREKNIMD